MTNDKFLILAYPGTGKTWVAENYQNVADLEFQHFRWDYGEYKNLPLEQLKGNKDIRIEKPNWLQNFREYILQTFEHYHIILVPMSTSIIKILDEIASYGVEILFVIHNPEAFAELKEVYMQRGNSADFIKNRENDFYKFYQIVENTKYKKVFLSKGEHLIDALLNLNIPLVKGKGFKNYY